MNSYTVFEILIFIFKSLDSMIFFHIEGITDGIHNLSLYIIINMNDVVIPMNGIC